MAISPGTDTFPLNQSGMVARTELFEKGTDIILVHSFQGPKHSLPQPKCCNSGPFSRVLKIIMKGCLYTCSITKYITQFPEIKV